MPTLSSPQIFITESDQTVFAGESSGPTAAIVLRNTYRGRENDKVLVTSEVDLINKFGNPSDNKACYCDMLSAIAYLKDSNSLYCTRVMPVSASFAGTTATSGVSATFNQFTFNAAPILGTPGIGDPDFYPEYTSVANPYLMNIIAKDRGHCGNYLRVAVCDKTNHDKIRARTDYLGWETFNAIYGIDSPLDSTKEFLVLVQECAQGRDTGTESNWATVEWWNVSNNLNKVNDVGQSMYVENVINTLSRYIRVAYNQGFNDTALGNFVTAEWQVLNGGRNNDTALLIADAPTNITVTSTIVIAGYNLYANAEEFDVDVLIDSDKDDTVKTALVALATLRKDCMAVIDCPGDAQYGVINKAGQEEQNLRTWMIAWRMGDAEANTSYAACYGNWLDVYDKYNSKYRWVPASGYVAGVFARCQNTAEYWSTPAGFTRGQINGVRRLAWNPTLAQRDGIYKYGINPIVSFAGQGKVVYGHKTMLDKYSAFNRINVRRMFISIENDIGKIARTYLFEANNTFHRNLFISAVKSVLDYAKANDGVESYKVVCDDTNNTPERVMNNELWMDIYVRPTYVADYILINFIATKSSTDFTELTVTTI